jgi:hypothetical protein
MAEATKARAVGFNHVALETPGTIWISAIFFASQG